ncbi:MAG: S-methyl-5-thioribose-1-phosphate isomerase, partial [Candidatus Melainabacteria bacterium RIFCSPHIGHO2_02_FULL_34_12]
AAYGMALAAYEFGETKKLTDVANEIKQSRPTAINLNWAVDLILNDLGVIARSDSDEAISSGIASPLARNDNIKDIVTKRAIWIHEDDEMRCLKIGEHGAAIVGAYHGKSVLTICNTGSLATGGIGTAFGVILTAYQSTPSLKIFVAETRPRQQGARLTTFEFCENGIECILVPDTACGYLMQKGEIDIVVTGADRIAANGDTANKIGTYQLAVLAKENKIPFYIAAPLSTFDLKITSGSEIPIEERDEKEITQINGKTICASGVKVRNPAFDVTPAKYISGIITEKGVLNGDYVNAIARVFNKPVIA